MKSSIWKDLIKNKKYLKVITLLVVFYLLIANNLIAQYYNTGQAPFSTKWNKIENSQYRLIFPKGLDSVALKYANTLKLASQHSNSSLKSKWLKMPIILYNQSVLSNGQVAWAPKRMELIGIAGQGNLFLPWYYHLVLHESRHVAQLSKMNSKTLKGLKVLLGEQIIPGVLGIHVPFWFLEGDAVNYETGATNGGRGSVPNFSMKLKAQLLDKGIYPYNKAMFGSYKDIVPNEYELGYYLAGKTRMDFENDVWGKALQTVSKYPFHWNPFSLSLKGTTGYTERKLYQKILSDLYKEYKPDSNIIESKYKLKPNWVENYYNPTMSSSGFVTYKLCNNKIPAFINIKNRKEYDIIKPGYMLDNTFSLQNNYLVWNEIKYTRWTHKNFNRIAVYNLDSKKLKYLENKGRVYGSKVNNTADKLVSVEVDDLLNWRLTIRSIIDGKLLNEFSFDTIQPVQPNWAENNAEIIFIGIGNHGKSLGIYSLTEKNINWILKNEKREFTNPKFYGDSILLLATYNNKTNLFVFDRKTKHWSVLTDVAYGIGEANIKNDTVVFGNYTADGYKLTTISKNEFLNKVINKPQRFKSDLVDFLSKNEEYIPISNNNNDFKIEKYNRFKYLFNVHSWAPMAIKIDNQEFGLGATILSQNNLSTSILSAGYQYYLAQNRDEYFINYEYKGFYPAFNAKYTISPHYTYDTTFRVNYLINLFETGVNVPFIFQKAAWSQNIQFELSYEYGRLNFMPEGYIDEELHKFKYGLYVTNKIRQSSTDLNPKWGQSVYLQYHHAPFDSVGELFAARTWLYFPGVINNHSFWWKGGFQQKQNNDIFYQFYDQLNNPRGYLSIASSKMLLSSTNYSFPIMYPDLSLLNALYIKRIKSTIFYDFGKYYRGKSTYYHESTGFELTADFHVFKIVAPIELGLRYARKLSYNENFFQILFKVNFSDLY